SMAFPVGATDFTTVIPCTVRNKCQGYWFVDCRPSLTASRYAKLHPRVVNCGNRLPVLQSGPEGRARDVLVKHVMIRVGCRSNCLESRHERDAVRLDENVDVYALRNRGARRELQLSHRGPRQDLRRADLDR